MASENLVGIGEIAEIAGVTKQVVSNWRNRYDNFPRPIQTLQSGPVWEKEAVAEWVRKRKGATTQIISFINLKGGVGKTTTAVAVGEMLAQEHRKSVLVIDLDPQTNATVTLIKEERWAEMNRDGHTVAQLFYDKLNPHLPPRFQIEKAIVRNVSTINDGIPRLELLPSSIQLIDIQEQLPLIAMSRNFTAKPLDVLKAALQPEIDRERWDYVLIDCPPSLGTVTKNGLRISTGYIIPTIPDILSTWGIYQIVDNIFSLAKDLERQIPALGIVATKVQGNDLHRRVIADMRAGKLGKFAESGAIPQPPLFDSEIPQTVAVSRGADVDAYLRTFKGKYGSAYEPLRNLTNEIRSKCETKKS